jgi:hypothetical protein
MGSATAHGSHLFLAHTSLQYLLATALAAALRASTPQPCRLLFLPDMLDPGLFLRAAEAWPASPFERVVFIRPRSRARFGAQRRGSGPILRELTAAIADAEPASLTVFNDRLEPGQAALITCARDFPRAPRRCAEDGSLAYTRFVYPPHGWATQLRKRLRSGRAWHDVRVLGTHPLVQQFIALHPSLLREELRQRPVQPFPSGALESAALHGLASALCEAAGFVSAAVPAGAAVLTVSHSSYAARNPDYQRLVRACAARLAARPERFFVKYHPRESQGDYLGLCAPGGAMQIAGALPVECLYLALRDRPLTVVGGMSTTLLTAGLLMPAVRCIALMHATDSGESWDPQLLEQLHITPLADEAAVSACFAG